MPLPLPVPVPLLAAAAPPLSPLALLSGEVVSRNAGPGIGGIVGGISHVVMQPSANNAPRTFGVRR